METKAPGAAGGALGMLPHVLSAVRVLLVLVIYAAAWRRDAPLFAVLVLLAVLTDILDGPLARHLGTADKFGANVDSASDFLFYVSLPAWVWLFRPELVATPRILVPAAVLTALYVGANAASQKTFGAMGVHNRLSRTSGTVGTVVAFYFILWGFHAALYYGLLLLLAADLAQRYGAVLHELRRRRRAGRAAPPQGR